MPMSHPVSRHRAHVALVLTTLAVSLGCDSRSNAGQKVDTAAATDPRTPVALPADGRQAVLREMRQMLGAVGGALSAAARADTAEVLAALAPAGSAAAADPALESLLPAPWKELAERTHSGFDSLSAAVRRAKSGPGIKDTVLVGIARITGSCTGCHETYRVVVR